MIRAENVNFAYRGGVPVLSGVNLRIERGEIAAIAGPNGVGKSTILKLLSGYLRPDSGKVLIDNRHTGAFCGRERALLLATVSQNVYASIPFTVKHVVTMGRLARLSRWQRLSEEDYELIDHTISELSLNTLCERPMTELSGGERQRVMVAAAMAQSPQVMLLDEPTAHLDIGNASRTINALLRWQRRCRTTVLMVTHDIQLAARISHRLILIKEGRVLADGTPAKILTPETLADAYGAGVHAFTDPRDGLPVILPEIEAENPEL